MENAVWFTYPEAERQFYVWGHLRYRCGLLSAFAWATERLSVCLVCDLGFCCSIVLASTHFALRALFSGGWVNGFGSNFAQKAILYSRPAGCGRGPPSSHYKQHTNTLAPRLSLCVCGVCLWHCHHHRISLVLCLRMQFHFTFVCRMLLCLREQKWRRCHHAATEYTNTNNFPLKLY